MIKKAGEKGRLKRESTERGDSSRAEATVIGLGEAASHLLGSSQQFGKQEWATVDVTVLCFSFWKPHRNTSAEKGSVGAQSFGSGTKLLNIYSVAL